MKKRILILLCAMALSPAVFASGSQNFFKLHIFDNDTREIKSLLNSQVRYANRTNFNKFIATYDKEIFYKLPWAAFADIQPCHLL